MSTPEPATAPAQLAVKAPSAKARPAKGPSRKKRAMRRRGRGRGDLDSDEEIEREAASSESEDDDDDVHSSDSDSATDDSDTEPGSEDVPSNIQSPSRSKDVGVEGVTHINGTAAPFFDSSLTWSEMVTDENERGAAGLPVIEFADFSETSKIPARPSKKSQKQKQKKAAASTPAAPPAEEPEQAVEDSAQPVAEPSGAPPRDSASTGPHRRLGQTARQAYQERLEKDPAFVPKVGGFWGHDDRLMDKDLRSLSGWWRGKWEGRGRGRGFGRGGGRGGHASWNGHAEVNPEDLPPVERTWTHDGFEEMKRKEEERQERVESARGGRGGFRGGRGGFPARGRGSMKQGPTGPAVMSPTQRVRPPFNKRKGETPWSQANPQLFPNNKKGIVVKIPGGKEAQVVKKEPSAQDHREATEAPAEQVPTEAKPPPLQYVVRLPKPSARKAKDVGQPVPVEESVASRPQAIEKATSLPNGTVSSATPTQAPVPAIPVAASISATISEGSRSSQPSPAVISQLEQLSIEPAFSDPGRQAKTEEAVLRKPSLGGQAEFTEVVNDRPSLPPLQTVFTPPPPAVNQPSPYTFPPALPPGIALNHHGMPYEMATGRPVYLQAPPPPPPMYNPRPIMHSHHSSLSYGHGPVPVMSPDFLSQPPSHTPPMNGFVDPQTGAPIFSFPRPNARVEIRAPDDPLRSPPSNGKAAANRGPSKLRTSATAFEPSRTASQTSNNAEGYYPSLSTPSDGSGLPPYETVNGVMPEEAVGQQQQQSMGPSMTYNPYQQPYYYPETYGWPGYGMDMSQQHHGQYDGYNLEQGQQGTVYY